MICLQAMVLAAVLAIGRAPGQAGQPASKQHVDLLVRGGLVLTMDPARRLIDHGGVAIAGNRIAGIGPLDEIDARFEAARVIEATGRLVMPGLINTHTHTGDTLLRGISDDVELMTWLQEYIWPAEAKNVTPEFVRWGTLLSAWEMIRSGTTTFADMFFFEDETATAAKQAGMRAVCASGILDAPAPGLRGADEALGAAEALLRKWQGDPLIVPAVGPHASYTCSPDTLLRARRLADRYGAPLMIHVAESPAEMQTVRERYGLSPVAHLERIGFLGPTVIAAHAVWLDEEDIRTLKRLEVGVAHCPQSNMKLGSGVAPVPALLRAGVKVGLGTDGAASNNDLDLFEEIDTACKLQKLVARNPAALTAREGVEMATIGAARALHLEDRIGSLEPGKRADLIIVALDGPNELPMYDVYSHLAYAIKAGDVESAIIDGHIVMDGRRMLTLDTAAIAAKAREYRVQVSKSLAKPPQPPR